MAGGEEAGAGAAVSPGPDLASWAEALKALSEAQLGELVSRLEGHAAYVPSLNAGRAAVATAVVEQMKLSPQVFEAVAAELQRLRALPPPLRLDRWLHLQWQHHRDVPVVGGLGEQYRLPIEDIYVPLTLADRTTLGPDGWEGCEPDGRPSRNQAAHQGSGRVSVEAAFAELERRRARSLLCGLSVVGNPGAGKTTLLSSLVAKATPAPRGLGSAALGLPADLLPVYLRFASLWRQVTGPQPLSLETLILQAVDARCPGAGPALLARGARLLILLDGLDEVPDEAARVAVCRWLVGQAPAWRDHARLVVTCRLAAWDRAGEALQGVLLPLGVQGFDREARERYVRAWFPLVYGAYGRLEVSEAEAEAAAKRRAEALLAAIASADAGVAFRLEAMARNPLLLSVMCLVHLKRGQLPRTRRQLYEECLSILLETWARHQERAQPIPAEPALKALAPLAWRMQSARAAGDQDATSLGEPEVLATLGPHARPERGLPLYAADFLRWLGDNGVLESPDVGRWRFSHLTFQEHLAARHASERNLEAELASHLEEAWWRETILLATAQPGFYLHFLEAAWAREPGAEGRALLRAARDESETEDARPHLRVLDAAVAALAASPPTPEGWWSRLIQYLGLRAPPTPPDPGPPPWQILLALDLAPVGAREALLETARPLVHHPDPAVASAVAALTGAPLPTKHHRPPEPGALRVFEAGGVTLEAVWVPPGTFWMGSGAEGEDGHDPEAYGDERPRHRVRIPQGFWLGRFPVTNGQYAAFVRGAGAREPFSMLSGGFDAPDQPVLEVDWREAMAFCAWWSGQPGAAPADLPTEAEWEWATRGPEGRRYPWGDEAPDPSRACYASPRPTPVGAHPAGRGPFGAEDQAGNAWEWTRSVARPYRAHDRIDHCQEDDTTGDAPRVLRGGSWFDPSRDLRAADRLRDLPGRRVRDFGFRVVFRSPPA